MIDRDAEDQLRCHVEQQANDAKRARDERLRALLLDAYKPRRGPLVMGGSW